MAASFLWPQPWHDIFYNPMPQPHHLVSNEGTRAGVFCGNPQYAPAGPNFVLSATIVATVSFAILRFVSSGRVGVTRRHRTCALRPTRVHIVRYCSPIESAAFEIESSSPGIVENLSEEEVLNLELAEEDLSLDECEEEEWAEYDAQVDHLRGLLGIGTSHAGSDAEVLEGDLRHIRETMAANSVRKISDEMVISNSDAEGVNDETRLELGLQRHSIDGLVRAAASDIDFRGIAFQLFKSSSDVEPRLRSRLEQMLKRTLPSEKSGPLRPLLMDGQQTWADAGMQWDADTGPDLELPLEYRMRLAKMGGSVVVSNSPGRKTMVLVGHMGDITELLAIISETVRAQRVRIVRGWLESEDGLAMYAFEVCSAETGAPLREDAVADLQASLAQSVQSLKPDRTVRTPSSSGSNT